MTGTDMQQAGARLEEVIRLAMPRADIGGIAELCRQAEVTRNTVYDWFRGRAVPTSRALERVGRIVKVPVSELWAAWEGTELRPPSLEAAIGKQAAALDRLSDRLDRLLRKMDARESGALAVQVRDSLLADDLVSDAVHSGLHEGRRRARRPQVGEAPSTPQRSPTPPARGAERG